MAVDTTWPISVATLRKAIGFETDQGDTTELELFAASVCERIDKKTGRDTDATRHLVDGHVPIIFIMAARRTAAVWWQQQKNGPRGLPSEAAAQGGVMSQSADLPHQVEAWLADYPAPPGFGQPIADPDDES